MNMTDICSRSNDVWCAVVGSYIIGARQHQCGAHHAEHEAKVIGRTQRWSDDRIKEQIFQNHFQVGHVADNANHGGAQERNGFDEGVQLDGGSGRNAATPIHLEPRTTECTLKWDTVQLALKL